MQALARLISFPSVDHPDLLHKIEEAVEAILSELGLSKDHVPVTEDKCHDLGE